MHSTSRLLLRLTYRLRIAVSVGLPNFNSHSLHEARTNPFFSTDVGSGSGDAGKRIPPTAVRWDLSEAALLM